MSVRLIALTAVPHLELRALSNFLSVEFSGVRACTAHKAANKQMSITFTHDNCLRYSTFLIVDQDVSTCNIVSVCGILRLHVLTFHSIEYFLL